MTEGNGRSGAGSLGSPLVEELRRTRPRFPHVGVLALGVARWSDRWSSQERMLLHLSRWFRVLWVNPPPHWRELLASPGSYGVRFQRLTPAFAVMSADHLYPCVVRPPSLRWALERRLLRRAAAALRHEGSRRVVLSIWHPRWARAPSLVAHDLSCYHVKDEYTYSATERPIPPGERRLLASVDQVFTVSRSLLEKKGRLNDRAVVIPNGVDFHSYARWEPEPADLAEVPRPRIGYTGWLKKQLDWELIRHLAARHPAWSFVLVGGRHDDPELGRILADLEALPNVFLLGARSSRELARYPRHFDVSVMPYEVNDYTRYIFPLKLHEYLAAGPPVVGSPIPALAPYRDVVPQPSGPDEWSRVLRRVVERPEEGERLRSRRRALARRHDWSILASRMGGVMAKRLEEDRVEREVREHLSAVLDGEPGDHGTGPVEGRAPAEGLPSPEERPDTRVTE